MLIEIEKVIVNDRIRKDFGNIDELAQDIKENGLINPPVVTPEFELIAGERRYRAMKSLGWQQIEVRVMSVQDALHKLKLEISENENRKEFSFAERMEWARLLEEELSKKAKENMGWRSDIKGFTGVSEKINTRKEVAKAVDMSETNYNRARIIYNSGNLDVIGNIENGCISINKAYQIVTNMKSEPNQRKQIPSATIKQLIARSGAKCEICDKGNEYLASWLKAHHIVEHHKTQDDSMENLIMLCPDCHGFIHDLKNVKDSGVRSNIEKGIVKLVGENTYNKIKLYI